MTVTGRTSFTIINRLVLCSLVSGTRIREREHPTGEGEDDGRTGEGSLTTLARTARG